ncbi:hypothetical protein [Sphingomonas beigongshangi]|uniref:hypothetical protein n=1 Tax=Sphingomonas beigongshangi TaxID=2782540 RepID=UPI001AEE35A1|nr:hypothetical protein [Sphingomonas beigongshangi]
MEQIIDYGEVPAVWVDDGHVYVKAYDGNTLRMKPEVAIKFGRQLETAGTESFINKVMDGDARPTDFPAPR